ncbi:MAG: aminotransferase class IV, partial [Bacteroidetes bacterium]|nr:aminotransferase class IV [Bacteroidota bacterium]
MSTLVNLDGDIVNSNTSITVTNRAFNYGDGLFETMRFMSRRVQFMDKHFHRLIKGMEVLSLNVPDYFSISYFNEQVRSLVQRLEFPGSVRVRLTIYRKDGGFFSPANNDVSFIIMCTPLVDGSYELNEKGHSIGIYDKIVKPNNELSNIKHLNCLPNVLAGVYCRKMKFEDCLLLNEKWQIVESISSNVFIVQEDEIITPPLEVGCVAGVMRSIIIEIAQQSGMSLKEAEITPEDLEVADEVFLTNAI